MRTPTCRIVRGTPSGLTCAEWESASAVAIAHFHERGSDHRPHTTVSALYDDDALHLRYDVDDCFVRSVQVNFQDPVCRDSCVEFFVQPAGVPGYFNFETNAGGTLHVWYVIDPTRNPDGSFCDARPLTPEEVARVQIVSSLPKIVNPEITEPIHWRLYLRIPFVMIATITKTCCGTERPWQGNFFKLGSGTSHPHWVSWSPIGSELNFHAPRYFGQLVFDQHPHVTNFLPLNRGKSGREGVLE